MSNIKKQKIINRQGCTRIVFLIWNLAIKIPNFIDGLRYFRKGWENNRRELFLYKKDNDALCPIKFSLFFSFILIMAKADEMSREDYLLFNSKKFLLDNNLSIEDKANSYGYLHGKVVVLDYGDWIE